MTVISGTGSQLVSVSGYPLGLSRPSVPLSAWYGGGQIQLSGDGEAVSFTQLYRTQPWISAAVNKLARQISRLPLKVFEKDSQNNRQRVHDHPLADLLSRPYPRGGPTHFKQKIAMAALLHGNSLIVKDRPGPGAPPTALLPIDWRFVIPHGRAGIEGQYIPGEVEFWEIVYPGEKAFVSPDETLHFRWEAPDGALGVSPLQQLGITIQSEDAAQRYTAASFQNAARPAGAVVLPADAKSSREVRQAIREEIEALHGGVDNAFRVAVLGGGADWKEFGQSAKEAELIETRKVNREEIAAVFDIPPPMIGILDNATYSNITEQHRMLYMTVLGPWLTMIEETIKAQLITPEPAWDGMFVEFDISEQLKGDPLNRSKAQALWIAHGVYTINEVRKLENLPPVANPICDTPLIPVNNLASATSLNPQEEDPVGTEPDDPTESPGQNAPPVAPTLSSHIARAGDRVARKMLAGSEDAWDRGRFVRELETDVKGVLGPGATDFAAHWGDALTAIVDDAGQDVQKLRRSLAALSR